MHRLLSATALLCGVLLCGCADTGRAGGAGGSVGGPDAALTVEQAMSRPGGPLRVRGALVIADGVARICDALAESHPPQCPNGVPVADFDEATLPPGTPSASGVRWLDTVELIVMRDGDGFRAVPDAR